MVNGKVDEWEDDAEEVDGLAVGRYRLIKVKEDECHLVLTIDLVRPRSGGEPGSGWGAQT
jgi:hypothetical protein